MKQHERSQDEGAMVDKIRDTVVSLKDYYETQISGEHGGNMKGCWEIG